MRDLVGMNQHLADPSGVTRPSLLALVHLPPPTHGISVVSEAVLKWLSLSFSVDTVNLSYGGLQASRSSFSRYLLPMVLALGRISGPRVQAGEWCYMALSGGPRQIFELLIILICRIRGIHIVVHHHSTAYINNASPIVALMYSLLSRDDVSIFLGSSHLNSFNAVYNNRTKSTVVSNTAFVDIPRATGRREPTGKLRVGILSNLELEKGLDTFFQAVRAIRNDGVEVEAVVAGTYRNEEARSLVESELRSGGTIYIGPVFGDQKRSFFEEIDIFLFPSRYRNETEPLVVLEAMAMGVPVVATPVGCLPEILPRSLIAAPSADGSADIEKIVRAINLIRHNYSEISAEMLSLFNSRRCAAYVAKRELASALVFGQGTGN